MNNREHLTSQISKFNEKNLSTYIDYSKEAPTNHQFIKQVISDDTLWGYAAKCPFNNHLHHFKGPQANVFSITTYGGPGSKYKHINEDSYFFGLSTNESIITGVIDGSGGSECGYLGGKLANQTLAHELQNGNSLKKAFQSADADVFLNGNGGFATGVAVEITPDNRIKIGSKGDSKALTLRDGKPLQEGVTKLHSVVAEKIENGELPPHAIHTDSMKNVIYSMIGDRKLPLFETNFQGQAEDTIVLASDGLWDVVSDYEIEILYNLFKGRQFQAVLYLLAYERNNSRKPYIIQFSPNQKFLMRPRFPNGKKCRGDNITVQVIELI